VTAAPRVPFHRACISGRERQYLDEAIASGHLSGPGPFTARCEERLAALTGAPRVLLTTSCTHALELAAFLLDLEPGDEVIVPSFTFVSTASAFALRGARLVFADVRPDTLNLDERLVDALITPRTRAIAPVHYAGIGCEMDALCAIAARRGVPLLEDNAHGLFGAYRGRPLGTFGRMATLSFHDTKNVTCGEGGALILNDPSLEPRAHLVREKGTNRRELILGRVDKYRWVDLGSSYVLSDLLAAYLLGQLEAADAIQQHRRAVWQRYAEELAPWADARGATLPTVPAGCTPAWHLFYLLLPTPEDRAALLAHTRAQGVGVTFHYIPLHSSPMGRALAARETPCPQSESVAERLVRLPLYNDMTDGDVQRVLDVVRAF
jgi:dTDP-4-amino-4,6-dideoxygalactose transaminase